MSDRYKFLKSWTDTGSGKTFAPGAVCRMSEGDAAPMVESGTLQQVAEFTICRKDIFAPGSCQPVTEEQAAAYSAPKTALKDTFAGTSLAAKSEDKKNVHNKIK